jgi:3'-phosphoadenosine 5'-phosphosulfate sulfotransferase (PAPS reductase)/FAD synthetase
MIEIIDQAIEKYKPIGIYALFSGGHDSLTATHIASRHPAFSGVIHIDTTTGLPETKEFVIETCKEHSWPLIIKKPFMPYESFLVRSGFPGGAIHNFMYQQLKERPLNQVIKEIRENFGIKGPGKVGLVSGVRKQESKRRAEIKDQLFAKGSKLWIPVIVNFSAVDCSNYIEKHGLKRSPVKDKIHMSGECFCGCFTRNGEFQEIEFWYPLQAERIKRWQKLTEVARQNQLWEFENGFRNEITIDHNYCKWGHNGNVPQEQSNFFSMCYHCRQLEET